MSERRIGRRGEQKRRWDREHANDGVCSQCSGNMSRGHNGGTCRRCTSEGREHNLIALEAMWADGLSLREIGAHFGWTLNHVSAEMGRARREGRDLPHRYRINPAKTGRGTSGRVHRVHAAD